MIELKWNKNVDGAVDQILKKKYVSSLENLGRTILLVGITYDKNSGTDGKKHICRIIEYPAVHH